VVAHCGAQTTAETSELAAHAAQAGAAVVSVIAPPYFALDERSLLAHFESAAAACSPLPFDVYEFADRSGYPVPPAVIDRLRERASNLVGLKVSDASWERFELYLPEGLDVFVGAEELIHRGLESGPVGAISGSRQPSPSWSRGSSSSRPWRAPSGSARPALPSSASRSTRHSSRCSGFAACPSARRSDRPSGSSTVKSAPRSKLGSPTCSSSREAS
jgi:Dihydrodipicolinate synthetase family